MPHIPVNWASQGPWVLAASPSFCYLQNCNKQVLVVPHSTLLSCSHWMYDLRADLSSYGLPRDPAAFWNMLEGMHLPFWLLLLGLLALEHSFPVLGKEGGGSSLSLHHKIQALVSYLFICWSCVLPSGSVASLPVPCNPTGFCPENIYLIFPKIYFV